MKITVEQLKPLHDRVLVEPIKAEELKTASGLILPKSEQEEKAMGIIVALGTGVSDRDFQVEEGDIVMYGKFSGQEIVVGEGVETKTYLVMRDADLLIKVKNQNNE